tara:strand:+ start:489 stop:1244 length:756 start_codon:yes stop_codon:yes gene_type:complete
MNLKTTTLATLIVLSLASTGTRGEDLSDLKINSPVAEMAKKDISKSKSVAHVLGAIIGAYACNKKLGNIPFRTQAILVCAKVSAEISGPLGTHIGKAIAIRRLKYANEYEFLESEIEASEEAISTREKEIKSTKTDISKAEKRISELKAKESLTTKEIKEAKKLKKANKERLEDNQLLEERYTQTLEYLDDTLEDSKENIADLKENKKETQAKYNDLKAKRASLAVQLAAVQQQTTQLKENQTILANMLSV